MLPIRPVNSKPIQNTNFAKKTGQISSFSVPIENSVEVSLRSTSVQTMANLGAASALFLQEVEDPLEKKKKHTKRGLDALSLLENLKNGLVTGTNNDEQNIIQLKNILAQIQENPIQDDLYLSSIMQQIEVRAAVELAKRGA